MSMTATESPPSLLSLCFLSIQHLILANINEDDQKDWDLVFSFFVRLVSYMTILAYAGLIFLVVSLIVKYIKEDCEEAARVQVGYGGESSRLISKETPSLTHGACKTKDEEDIEAGECSSSRSSEDLYDGKLCVVCYDEERNCFFVPCGHCATCYTCAQRIIGENRSCVICRRLIRKVRRLITS